MLNFANFLIKLSNRIEAARENAPLYSWLNFIQIMTSIEENAVASFYMDIELELSVDELLRNTTPDFFNKKKSIICNKIKNYLDKGKTQIDNNVIFSNPVSPELRLQLQHLLNEITDIQEQDVNLLIQRSHNTKSAYK